ncbi:MAG: hypothetical protein ABSA53_32160 [Streptosporangiaceae bacterium]
MGASRPSLALLAAQIAMAAFGHATREWGTNPSGDLRALLAQSFDDLRILS